MLRSVFNTSKINGVKTSGRFFHTTIKPQTFNLQLETEIRDTIAALPPVSKLYKNADGTSRDPSDSELKLLSKLTTLTTGRKISLFEGLTLKKEYGDLYIENQENLESLVPSYENGASGKIVDKIPYEDPSTGEVKWQVVREDAKEGWEKIMYFGFVPSMFLMLGIILFKPEGGIREWADKELQLRAQEEHFKGDTQKAWDSLSDSGLSAAEKKKRDEVVVERILSGEYDRLAGLKINAQKLPIEEAKQ
ncbi:hypothetical protein DASC09_032900 [Saccharomycopsis crataegensis]|uniref:NADH-ubiquinone oxidoreductase ESSS subunit n=1 Tax=Saccharomycopsis crataegensis TaxID=43959 RepID=A0AAV5QLY0_9ASCO|nr:hypothetical protein DASC09_032900 [Saccharomycopsis crataegensis]